MLQFLLYIIPICRHSVLAFVFIYKKDVAEVSSSKKKMTEALLPQIFIVEYNGTYFYPSLSV